MQAHLKKTNTIMRKHSSVTRRYYYAFVCQQRAQKLPTLVASRDFVGDLTGIKCADGYAQTPNQGVSEIWH